MPRALTSPSFLVLLALCLLFTGLAWMKGQGTVREGYASAWQLFWFILPSLVVGFILGGLIQVLLPRDLVAAWAGEDSGLRGLIIATGRSCSFRWWPPCGRPARAWGPSRPM
jgi:uncharacterized membrane protein YraQ (UPF0718 family)